MLPILSYGCEVWGVDTKCGAAAEALHRDFLRRLLGVRKCTANHMILAELGCFPLQVHFWQQILRHRTIALDNVRLVKLAMVGGFALDQTAVKDSWQHYLKLAASSIFCMVTRDSSSFFTVLTCKVSVCCQVCVKYKANL